MELVKEATHASVSDPVADSMNLLNEIAGRFPAAISLAARRPYEEFYRTEDISRFLHTYVSYLEHRGFDARRTFMQYGRTNGQIHDLIAQMLGNDEGIVVPGEQVCAGRRVDASAADPLR
jgi:(S)-3,5-dihydroxyphenylglycine transaminase